MEKESLDNKTINKIIKNHMKEKLHIMRKIKV